MPDAERAQQTIIRTSGAVVPTSDESLSLAIRVMEARGLTPATLASQIGMSRSRAYRVMAKDESKRSTVRVDEIEAILRVLGLDAYNLGVISELANRPDASFAEDLDMAYFFGDLLTGMVSEFVEGISDISGLSVNDLDNRHRSALRQQTVGRLIDRLRWWTNHQQTLQARFADLGES